MPFFALAGATSSTNSMYLLDMASMVKWRYEVDYLFMFLNSPMFKQVAQALPGSAPSRRKAWGRYTGKSEICLYKARKLVVWADPSEGFSGPGLWKENDTIRFEPWIAFSETDGDDGDGQWGNTWSRPGELVYTGGSVLSTGRHKTFGQHVWDAGRKSLTVYVHRKIRRYDVLVGENEFFLPVLTFDLKDEIGETP